jgi:hypothetical protein
VHALPPTLSIVDRAPLVVRGRGFRPHELVRVSGPTAPRAIRVRTTASGGFVVTFAGADRCTAIVLAAVGARGDRAVLHLPQPLCAPATSP